MKRLNIGCIFGTRPELIKMAPVIHGLKQLDDVRTQVICSGQHRELLYPLIDWFDLSVDINLDLMQKNQNLNTLSSKLMAEFGQLFEREAYDCVIAQGDTTTVLMAAIAAFYAKIPFAHVEAGLRTFDMQFPFPEEMNRVLAGRVATLHFAPTKTAATNLLNEGIAANQIVITGNTVIDALQYTTRKLNLSADDKSQKVILVTMHRRENFGAPAQRICQALLKIAERFPDYELILPVHPNPNVKEMVYSILGNTANITLCDPLSYEALVALLAKAHIVITDSGGIQEEAPALKKPVLVLRHETERPELVELGGAYLVGSDDQLIYDTVVTLLTDEAAYKKMIVGYSPYGDGNAAKLIIDKIMQYLSTKSVSHSAA